MAVAVETSERFQQQLGVQLATAAEFSIGHVERHNALPPLKSARRPAKEEFPTAAATDVLSLLKDTKKRRKKLTSVESERLMIIYDEMARRVKISLLVPQVCQQGEDFFRRYSIQLGDEICSAIERHQIVVDMSTEHHADSSIRQLQIETLQVSVRHLVRLMSADPHVSSLLLSPDFKVESSQPGTMLVQVLQDHRRDLREHLAESQQDELVRIRHVNDLRKIQSLRATKMQEAKEELDKKRDLLSEKVS